MNSANRIQLNFMVGIRHHFTKKLLLGQSNRISLLLKKGNNASLILSWPFLFILLSMPFSSSILFVSFLNFLSSDDMKCSFCFSLYGCCLKSWAFSAFSDSDLQHQPYIACGSLKTICGSLFLQSEIKLHCINELQSLTWMAAG